MRKLQAKLYLSQTETEKNVQTPCYRIQLKSMEGGVIKLGPSSLILVHVCHQSGDSLVLVR